MVRLARVVNQPQPYVALITGASSGIGEATARRVARGVGGLPVKLVLVARRRDRLDRLAAAVGGATVLALDVTDPGAPTQIRDTIEREHGRLDLLVNNAGAAWRGGFADTGWANLERHMKLNFEAPARLIEALLPLLRRSAESAGRRVSIVNVASTAARVSRPSSGAYSASKFALAGWSDALHLEEAGNRVHVGVVLPGFIKTEGFPAAEIPKWMVSTPDRVAEAIMDAGPGGKAERYVPRPYWLAAATRILAPRLVRRATAGGGFTTATGNSDP
jgi:short-subunit dehydrogenase